MNRLTFAPIGDAFVLGSDQIKKTQEEIAKLKQMIAAGGDGEQKKSEYTRIGKPDIVTATFEPPKSNQSDELEMSILKIINHPKFDDIVKSYVLMKKPDWILSETNYRPAGMQQQPISNVPSISKFGATSTTTTSDNQVGRFFLFIIIALTVYALLSMFFNST